MTIEVDQRAVRLMLDRLVLAAIGRRWRAYDGLIVMPLERVQMLVASGMTDYELVPWCKYVLPAFVDVARRAIPERFHDGDDLVFVVGPVQ